MRRWFWEFGRRAGGRPWPLMRLATGLLTMASLLAACATGTSPPISPASTASLAASLGLDAEILPRVLAAGPWPPSGAQAARDRGNPLSGQAEAILLGQQLFLDPRLSRGGDLACASCHVPGLAFTDGRPRAQGAGGQRLDRHTPTLWNIGLARWQAWDGAADSAWSQALRPLLDAREMGQTPAGLAALVAGDGELACRYRRVFQGTEAALPQPPQAPPDQVLTVNLARAIGAFTASLVSGRTPFDDFRDAVARGDAPAALAYPAPARRGLILFMGSARCHFCHLGPTFSHGEFGDVGLPFFVEPGRVDPGRQGGIRQLMASPYRLDGPWSAASPAERLTTVQLKPQPRNFGEFKVPGLRNVALTAPHVHDGQLADLDAVLRYYNEIDLERLHADGENLLEPLKLSPADLADLRAFLESLSDPAARQWQPTPVPPCVPASSGNNAAPAR